MHSFYNIGECVCVSVVFFSTEHQIIWTWIGCFLCTDVRYSNPIQTNIEWLWVCVLCVVYVHLVYVSVCVCALVYFIKSYRSRTKKSAYMDVTAKWEMIDHLIIELCIICMVPRQNRRFFSSQALYLILSICLHECLSFSLSLCLSCSFFFLPTDFRDLVWTHITL